MENNNLKPLEVSIMEQQNQVWVTSISQITHFLVNKMATLRGKQAKLKEIVPILLDNYHLTVEKNMNQGEIKERYLETMDCMINLEEQIAPVIALIRSLESYFEPLRHYSKTVTLLSAKQSIADFLQNYPFALPEQKEVILFEQTHDFNFNFSPILFNALLHNILSQLLKSLVLESKQAIHISITEDKTYHRITINSVGFSLPVQEQSQLFNALLSQQNDHFLPALGLCRLALLQAGGAIECEGLEGQSTCFKIDFLKLK